MKVTSLLLVLFLMSSCAGVNLKRSPASEPAEVVVAETFNTRGIKYSSSVPKGFRVSSCSLRSVKVDHNLKKAKRALAVVFTHTNDRGDLWTSPYHYLAYEKADKTLTMIDSEGKEVGGRFLKRKGKLFTNSFFNKELREFGFENVNEKSSIKLYQATRDKKLLSACVF